MKKNIKILILSKSITEYNSCSKSTLATLKLTNGYISIKKELHEVVFSARKWAKELNCSKDALIKNINNFENIGLFCYIKRHSHYFVVKPNINKIKIHLNELINIKESNNEEKEEIKQTNQLEGGEGKRGGSEGGGGDYRGGGESDRGELVVRKVNPETLGVKNKKAIINQSFVSNISYRACAREAATKNKKNFNFSAEKAENDGKKWYEAGLLKMRKKARYLETQKKESCIFCGKPLYEKGFCEACEIKKKEFDFFLKFGNIRDEIFQNSKKSRNEDFFSDEPSAWPPTVILGEKNQTDVFLKFFLQHKFKNLESVIPIDLVSFIQVCRNDYYGKKVIQMPKIESAWKRVNNLVLDRFPNQFGEFFDEFVSQILNYRLNNNKKVIIATQYSADRLKAGLTDQMVFVLKRFKFKKIKS